MIVEIARNELGTSDGRKYILWYNQMTGKDIALGSDWCAAFVSWCADMAGAILPPFSWCDDGIEYFKRHNQWRQVPSKGSVVFFDWNLNRYANHVGIVEQISETTIYTIEGNSYGSCRRRQYLIEDPAIMGYGVLKYEEKEEESEEDEMQYFGTLRDVPPYYRPTIEKLLVSGALRGVDENPPDDIWEKTLNISEDYCRVMVTLDRLGALEV